MYTVGKVAGVHANGRIVFKGQVRGGWEAGGGGRCVHGWAAGWVGGWELGGCDLVGGRVGDLVGGRVGDLVGGRVGDLVGGRVGEWVGGRVGGWVGRWVGGCA